MPNAVSIFVRTVDAINRWVGLVAMYLIFVMIAILLYSSFMKTFSVPPLWTLEMAQFAMVAYFMLGGGFSLQDDAHVRMDLWYSRWSPRRRALVDCFTILCLIFYLCFMFYGGLSSTAYALRYGETSYSSWAPWMAPIKIIMVTGIALMLLQALAQLLRDIAMARGSDPQ